MTLDSADSDAARLDVLGKFRVAFVEHASTPTGSREMADLVEAYILDADAGLVSDPVVRLRLVTEMEGALREGQTRLEAAREADALLKAGEPAVAEPVEFNIFDHAEFDAESYDLRFTDEAARGKASRSTMSLSTMKSMEECPAQWAAKAAGPRVQDPWAANGLGSSAHTVAERFFELPAEERTVDTARRLLDEVAAERLPDASFPSADEAAGKRAEYVAAVQQRMAGFFDLYERPEGVRVVATEMKVSGVQIAGVPFTGAVDRIDEDPETGGWVPVDVKTGDVPDPRWGDAHGDQLRLYVAAIEAKTGTAPLRAQVHYVQVGQVVEVDLSPEAMAATQARFVKEWRNLQRFQSEGVFPTRCSGRCGRCELVGKCPKARMAGYMART